MAPAVAAGLDAAERQEMTLGEAREYTDSLGFDAPDVDLVEASEITTDGEAEAADDSLDHMPEAVPHAVTAPEAGTVTLDLPEAGSSGGKSPGAPERSPQVNDHARGAADSAACVR